MSQLTDVYVNKEDLGKNLYRNKTYYTLCIEQDCLATNKDEADKIFSDNGGINHDKINKDLTDANNGVETYMVDANYTDSGDTKFLGKVVYDEYDGLENAKENGDVEIDTYALETDVINDKGEVVAKQEEMDPLGDLKKIVDSGKPIKEPVPF
tara:strand:- start:47 stop:505 length:459 start_codon:yes stop_codon:yes gene_type:complete